LRHVNLISTKQINLKQFAHLKYLDLSHNQLTRLEYDDFETFLTNLEHLDVSFNQIYFVDEAILSSSNLDSTEENIISFLNFEHNNLSVLVNKFFYNYLNLKTLKLSFNSITFIPRFKVNDDVSHLSQNEAFYFDHNQIEILTEFNIWNHPLTIINLDFNRLASIDKDALFNMISLRNLSMSMNSLTKIEVDTFQKCYDLNYLNLSHNLIEFIEEDSFLNLNKLLSLDLSYNCLKRLEANLFRGLQRLSSLYVQSLNSIEINNRSFWYLTNISNIYLNELIVVENKCLFMDSLFERFVQRNLRNHYVFFKAIYLITSNVKSTNTCFLTFHLLQMRIHLDLKTDYQNEIFYDLCQNSLIRFSNTYQSNLKVCSRESDFSYLSRWNEKNESTTDQIDSLLIFTNYVYVLSMFLLISLFVPVSFLVFKHLC